MRFSLALSAYLAFSARAARFAERKLASRLAEGKEDAARIDERRGIAGMTRPEGELVWFHAASVGESLSLLELIRRMIEERPDLHVLVTTGTVTSAEVMQARLPKGAMHQFIPVDVLPWVRRFLDHWRPDVSVWAEQDLWPGLVAETARRGIPLALVNARMNADAYRRRARARGLYAPLLRAFRLIAAQDAATTRHLEALGAPAPVAVTGSLKPAAPPLADSPQERAHLAEALAGRPLWLAASTHAEDEEVALAAHRLVLERSPHTLLILAPRIPSRGAEIAQRCEGAGLAAARRSDGAPLASGVQVYIADTIGEMGLWYRLAPAALVGGSFGPVEGHNPWEPARVDCAVLHGPRTANFAEDYAALAAARAARRVLTAEHLTATLADPQLAETAERAAVLALEHAGAARALARHLVELVA